MKGDKILVDYANRNHERKEFLHSSGYAEVQSGDNIGVDSAVSFAKRQALERNREHIQKFQHSLVNAKRNIYSRAKTYEADQTVKRPAYGAPKTTDASNAKAPQIPTRRPGI